MNSSPSRALRVLLHCPARLLAALLLLLAPRASAAAEASLGELFQQAQAAQRAGRGEDAIRLATEALALAKKDPTASPAAIYQFRGAEHFRRGRVAESLGDFDKAVEANPSLEPHNWQRGIAQYYAGQFAAGRKQFELHQTVNRHDVENAVWHYLCAARETNVEKARAGLIPIQGDARVPMAQIHALYAGKGKPGDVLAAARAGDPPPAELKDRMFYAHLYLGLYYEAAGDAAKAREHIDKSVSEFRAEHYMGDVARVHARQLSRKN